MSSDLSHVLLWSHDPSDNCPFCGTSLLEDDVREGMPGWYRPGLHKVRRELGVETDESNGEVLYYVCPDCHHGWPQFTGTGPLVDLAAKEVAVHEQSRAALVDLEVVRNCLDEHAKAIGFGLGIFGFTWVAWAVDPRDGATLYLLCTAEDSGARVQAQDLIGDITGFPTVRVVGETGEAARSTLAVRQPGPNRCSRVGFLLALA